ncbi:MAG: hypothetical protein E6G73_01945 [Alphaproteobacteria bacterium]|nr:MAG: hypothetical protein E6G73_01945 [Alphaproteobacteria bacterium]
MGHAVSRRRDHDRGPPERRTLRRRPGAPLAAHAPRPARRPPRRADRRDARPRPRRRRSALCGPREARLGAAHAARSARRPAMSRLRRR